MTGNKSNLFLGLLLESHGIQTNNLIACLIKRCWFYLHYSDTKNANLYQRPGHVMLNNQLW